MTPEQHAQLVSAAVAILRQVAVDDLREGEGCEHVLSNVRMEPDFHGPSKRNLVGDCRLDGDTRVAWITGNAQNARDAIITLTGHRDTIC